MNDMRLQIPSVISTVKADRWAASIISSHQWSVGEEVLEDGNEYPQVVPDGHGHGAQLRFICDIKGTTDWTTTTCQLTEVRDDAGKVLEKYSYDLAGNLLSRTVNGLTTTFVYDAANQLVSSIDPRGKVTYYAYDAAGRLVREGERRYAYGWLDKVLEIEGPDGSRRYSYGLDGQLARATAPDGQSEEFLWDGLALVSRGSTQFLNEPFPTGGNPVLSSEAGILFNDHLGSTTGTLRGGEFAPVAMTAFGETEDAAAFFTGKPFVDGLGYAFLLRNYRPDHGKWLTRDPFGYPDGWNDLAYCGNDCFSCIDLAGGSFWHWVGEQALAGTYGVIYFFNTGNNSVSSICPANCGPVLQWLSTKTIKSSDMVISRINVCFASSLALFSASSNLGSYSFEVGGMRPSQANIGGTFTWGAIVGTGTFGILTASANIYMSGNNKMIDITLGCQYYDEIDWRSREELGEGYFGENAPWYMHAIGNLEVFGDAFFDNTLHLNYEVDVRWNETRTFRLE